MAKLAGWLIFGVVISAVLFMLSTSFLGWRFDMVPTGSMEPAFKPGGMVVTRPLEMEDIKIGDAILFSEPRIGKEARIAHRVIDIGEVDGQLFFQTKGDANEYADPDLVSPQDFIGKTILYLPRVGNIAYLSRLHETPITLMGKKVSVAMLLIVAIALAVIGAESRKMWEWTFRRELMRHREVVKKRKQRAARRRRRYA
ncbi:MAG: signal peptidase I [Chloroflexi bacterium]|nr:signal peptidase I [Chloroflexota bacterium]